jgi:hypothetical protein
LASIVCKDLKMAGFFGFSCLFIGLSEGFLMALASGVAGFDLTTFYGCAILTSCFFS